MYEETLFEYEQRTRLCKSHCGVYSGRSWEGEGEGGGGERLGGHLSPPEFFRTEIQNLTVQVF